VLSCQKIYEDVLNKLVPIWFHLHHVIKMKNIFLKKPSNKKTIKQTNKQTTNFKTIKNEINYVFENFLLLLAVLVRRDLQPAIDLVAPPPRNTFVYYFSLKKKKNC